MVLENEERYHDKVCCDAWSKVGSRTAPMKIISEPRTLMLSNKYCINKKKIKFQGKTRYNNNNYGIKLNKTLKWISLFHESI